MTMFESVSSKLSKAKNIVFVTGAGISQESGIPTFRGKDGLWRNHSAMRLASIEAFNQDPEFVWEWYNERRKNIFEAKPNGGHLAIAKLEKYANVTVLTQNIDGLHQKAGSTKVLELHGSIIRIKCTVCDFKNETDEEITEIPPKCKCGNILRPDVVWFGENLNDEIWKNAIDLASHCDLMIIAGTSLVVSPSNSLPTYAKENGATLIEINPVNTRMSSQMDLAIKDTSVNALSQLISIFKKF